MLYATPVLDPDLRARLEALDATRKKLADEVTTSSPWLGTLRRQVMASSVESSTSIEGFSLAEDEALAVIEGQRSQSGDENRMAVACYARAMNRVGALATDPVFRWSDRVILDLHFDVCEFQRNHSPGRWRTGPVSVTGAEGIAYRGPDADQVPGLMAEVAEWLESGDLEAHPAVRAAMAHLHVVSVHPFHDGNGRMSRIVQSLVLAREGLMAPEFGSIEEFLAEKTPAYYAVLEETQGGAYQPDRDASSWVDFCIAAHLAQATRRLSQVEAAAARWTALEKLTDSHGWPERLVIALEQSLKGGTDRAGYSAEADIAPVTATGDLRRLADTGLVEQQGEGRSTRYRASRKLRGVQGVSDRYMAP